jgi:hypothetical protein
MDGLLMIVMSDGAPTGSRSADPKGRRGISTSIDRIESNGALPMVMEQNSMMDKARLVRARSISEIKDAVRELKKSTPDSVLAKLAEQKIESMEKGHDSGRNPRRDPGSQA